jgi:hypothetical protein
MLSFNQIVEQERRRWMLFRRVLSKDDQEAFDRMFADATQHLQAEVQIGRPSKFEAVMMAMLFGHEKLFEQVRMRLEDVSAEKHLRDGNCPEGH